MAFVACVLTPTEGTGFAITAWAAGAASPGLAVVRRGRCSRSARCRRRGSVADFVIVAVHAGDEYRNAPNATQRAMAEAALAAGADAYIGAHAHVVQPVEQRGNQLIAWGLGNFIFDLDNVDLANIPQPRVAPILKITLTKGAGVTALGARAAVDAGRERRPPAACDGGRGGGARDQMLERLAAREGACTWTWDCTGAWRSSAAQRGHRAGDGARCWRRRAAGW